MAKRTDVSQLKIGDKFYRVVHYEVTGIEGNNVHTKSDTAGHSTISKSLVENSSYTTNQYVEKKKVTRTQLAQKIDQCGNKKKRDFRGRWNSGRKKRESAWISAWTMPTLQD
jgi:N-acetylmuramoyl-L-alanine amidase CwlA